MPKLLSRSAALDRRVRGRFCKKTFLRGDRRDLSCLLQCLARLAPHFVMTRAMAPGRLALDKQCPFVALVLKLVEMRGGFFCRRPNRVLSSLPVLARASTGWFQIAQLVVQLLENDLPLPIG